MVHFHNLWPLLTPAALRHARRAGARVVLTAHNCRFACPGGTCPARASDRDRDVLDNPCLAGSSLRCAIRYDPRDARAESLVYGVALEAQRRLGMLRRWVDAFISPSRYVAAMLGRIGVNPARIHVIANGVEVGEQAPPGDEFALYVGRLDAMKGTATLLRAAGADAGAGGDRGRGRARARGAPRSRPATWEAGPRCGVSQAIGRAAFTVMPSECRENYPYAVAESFAGARAAVASRIGGLPELVQDDRTGLLVEPGDAEGLAAAIDRLWADRELSHRLGAEAHRVASERLRIEDQIDRTIRLYERLVAR